MSVRLLVAALLGVACLGGCSDGASGSAEVASSVGLLRGVVVDEAIRPLGNASVTAAGTTATVNATTTDDGLFAFEGLEPGVYVVTVTKQFYSSQQTTADVRLGEEGPLVKFTLQPETGL